MKKKYNESFINKNMDKFVLLYGNIFKKISDFFALLIAIIFFSFYQLFVQILWLGIAVKFLEFLLSFKLLSKIDNILSSKLQKTSRWESFFIFIIPLIPMEYFAILAGIAFVKGNIAIGIILYLLKFACAIPVSYIYKHTKRELLQLGRYKSFDISYTDEEFFIAHNNKHTSFNMSGSNIPLGWVSLPKFIINLIIYLIKNSLLFINITSWFRKIKSYIKEKYITIKTYFFTKINFNNTNKKTINIKYKINKFFIFFKNKFNKKGK